MTTYPMYSSPETVARDRRRLPRLIRCSGPFLEAHTTLPDVLELGEPGVRRGCGRPSYSLRGLPGATGKIRRVDLRKRAVDELGGTVTDLGTDSEVRALLPPSLRLERPGTDGAVAVLRLARAAKRNALDDATVLGIEAFFANPPSGVRAVVLAADGRAFLRRARSRRADRAGRVRRSRTLPMMWHRAFERVERGRVPVIAVLKGAVIGGGLELACAAHVRVAEPSAFYALPEGQRGIFVGGGASVRLPRLIGAHRMADMMLTGRVLDADEGHVLGITQYRADMGQGFALAMELARKVAANSPVTNFAVLQALPRIAEANPAEGYLMESLMAAVATGSAEAQERMQAFLEGRAGKVGRG